MHNRRFFNSHFALSFDRTFALVFSLTFTSIAVALAPQVAATQSVLDGSRYSSGIDETLTIRNVGVLPVTDNVGSIYSRAVENKLVSLLKESHKWSFEKVNFAGRLPSLESLEESPKTVQGFAGGTRIDALIATRVTKGPGGMTIKMNLFTARDGLLISQESLREEQGFDFQQVEAKTERLFSIVMKRVPYSGLILSRVNQRVTMNLGKTDQVEVGEEVSVVQIIKTNRHPKFGFIVSTEKEVLGKIKIMKVDDSLSFGFISVEKEPRVIVKNSKIAPIEKVQYQIPSNLSKAKSQEQELARRNDNDIAFGESPKEWLPTRPPTFGMVQFLAGLGTYSAKTTLETNGGLESSNAIYPEVALSGELWINPKYTVKFNWIQGIASSVNPLAGSAPSKLTHSLSAFSLFMGYNFLLEDRFFGPKVQVGVGFAQYKDTVDNSDPVAFTSASYSGITFNLNGEFPVTPDGVWTAGAGLNLVFKPSLNETPVTSGSSSSNSVNDLHFFGRKKLGVNLFITGQIGFRLYQATFSGTGTRSERASTSSQNMMTFSGGVSYMF